MSLFFVSGISRQSVWLLAPVPIGDKHWVLLVANTQNKTVTVFNSLRNQSEVETSCCENFIKWYVYQIFTIVYQLSCKE